MDICTGEEKKGAAWSRVRLGQGGRDGVEGAMAEWVRALACAGDRTVRIGFESRCGKLCFGDHLSSTIVVLVEGGQHYVPRYLCSPLPMFPDFCTLIVD